MGFGIRAVPVAIAPPPTRVPRVALGATRGLVMVTGGNDRETLVGHLGALAGGHVSWRRLDRQAADLVDGFAPDVVARSGGPRPAHPGPAPRSASPPPPSPPT
jgi:hypothetical protein